MEIIIGRQGEQKLPITDSTVSRKHCKLTTNPDGTYTIEGINGAVVMVDGRPVVRSLVTLDSMIGLGPRFKSKLVGIIGNPNAAKMQPPPYTPPQNPSQQQFQSNKQYPEQQRQAHGQGHGQQQQEKVYNISHLKWIWDDFNNTNVSIAKKQHSLNMTRTGLGLLTLCTMPLMYVIGPFAFIFTGIAIVGNLYSFLGMKNIDSPEKRQQRQEEFEDQWVCPNPECNRTLPARNYKALVRNHHSCPYCKVKYVEA